MRYHEAIAGKRAVYGPGHYEVAQTTDNLAVVLEAASRFEDTVPLRRETLVINRRAFGATHERTRRSLFGLVDGLVALDSADEARAVLDEVIEATDPAAPGAGPLLDGARLRLVTLNKRPESGDG